MNRVLPLQGVAVLEFEGIGPGPLAGMMLADMGAAVTVVKRPQRPGVTAALPDALPAELGLDRGKQSISLDLKTPQGVQDALTLCAAHDVLIEGLRPGTMEKLGLGPHEVHRVNAKLVYGRITGWGQTGPLAHAAGHDLNYVALTGLLHYTQRAGQPPIVPPTVTGDAAGALGLALGIAAALVRSQTSGQGCVVDAAMVDIACLTASLIHLTQAAGGFPNIKEGKVDPRGPLHGSVFHGSPFYDTYATQDARWITLCALEPQFYAELLTGLGLADLKPQDQFNPKLWPVAKARIAGAVAQHSMAHWQSVLEGTDVCFAPALTLAEAAAHPHIAARQSLRVQEHAGRPVVSSGAAPRFFT